MLVLKGIWNAALNNTACNNTRWLIIASIVYQYFSIVSNMYINDHTTRIIKFECYTGKIIRPALHQIHYLQQWLIIPTLSTSLIKCTKQVIILMLVLLGIRMLCKHPHKQHCTQQYQMTHCQHHIYHYCIICNNTSYRNIVTIIDPMH